MSNQYALVQNGVVVNTILWDGNAETWLPPQGQKAIPVPDGSSAAIGWTWDGTRFAQPPSP